MAMAKEYECSLPETVLTVPCHLSWIPEFLPDLEVLMKEKADSLEEYLEYLIQKKFPSNGEEIGNDYQNAFTENCSRNGEGSGAHGHSLIEKLAEHFTQIAFAVYNKNFPIAKEVLKTSKKTLKAFCNHPKESEAADIAAIKYCMAASEWQIKFQERSIPSGACADEEITNEGYDLIAIWEHSNNQPENKRFLATITFFKGSLAGSLRVKRDNAADMFKTAALLDEESYLWNHYAYASLRRKRRLVNYNLSSSSREPSEEETFYKKAYQLCPNELIVTLDHALQLKDQLWCNKTRFGDNASWTKCVSAFENALKTCKSSKMEHKKERADEVTIYLAEVLLFGRNDKLDRERGKKLLESCEESTKLLHKLARMHQGIRVNGILKYKDYDQAEKFYLRALELDPGNFSCLLEYLRFLQEKKKDYCKMVSTIDSVLENLESDIDMVTLLLQRGFAIWLAGMDDTTYYKRGACNSWIDALIKFPDFADKIKVGLKDFVETQQMHDRSIREHIMDELRNVQDDVHECWEVRRQAKTLIDELVKMVTHSETSPTRFGSRSRSSTYFNPWQRSFHSLPDSGVNGNWRDKMKMGKRQNHL